MKDLRISMVILALAAASASAQVALEFDEVDVNGDDVLSFAEFQSALPTLVVSDANGDGMLNQVEVERALPDLSFRANGFQGGMALVSDEEYRLILSMLRLDGES